MRIEEEGFAMGVGNGTWEEANLNTVLNTHDGDSTLFSDSMR